MRRAFDGMEEGGVETRPQTPPSRGEPRNWLRRTEQRRLFWTWMPPALVLLLLVGQVERVFLAPPAAEAVGDVDTVLARGPVTRTIDDAVTIEAPAVAPAEDGAARKPANARDAAPIGLGAEGTTRFNWKQRMALERVVDDRFTVRMEDGVEILHAGVREKDELTMRCDAVEALVKRPDERAKSQSDAGAGVDLGGPAELLGVKGSGNVFIRTPTQDLECGEFDYSVASGLATLKAAPGRAVTVVFANKPTPLQAQEIEWDMRSGTLEIRKPLVTGGR